MFRTSPWRLPAGAYEAGRLCVPEVLDENPGSSRLTGAGEVLEHHRLASAESSMLIAYPSAASKVLCSTGNVRQESRAWELDTLGQC